MAELAVLALTPKSQIGTWGTRLGSIDSPRFRIEYLPVETKPVASLPDRNILLNLALQNCTEWRIRSFLEALSLCLDHSTLNLELHTVCRIFIGQHLRMYQRSFCSAA